MTCSINIQGYHPFAYNKFGQVSYTSIEEGNCTLAIHTVKAASTHDHNIQVVALASLAQLLVRTCFLNSLASLTLSTDTNEKCYRRLGLSSACASGDNSKNICAT